jgi:acetolactate synthase-1/2/3 large subunit
LPHVERIAYLAELASVQLQGLKHLILVDAKSPVSFFAYPGKASDLVPEGCAVHTLTSASQDAVGDLQRLASKLGADAVAPLLQPPTRPDRPRGRLTAEKVCKAVGHLLPERAIIVDEAQTSGVMLPHFTKGAPRHDVITLTGGAIGQGLPNAVGAAIACPERPVLALVGDGSAMYTIQALWTMARERLNVTTVILNNKSYAILNVELQRVGATGPGTGSGDKARSQLDLSNPGLDFVQLGASMGVHSVRATTAEELNTALENALRSPGPHLIEALVPNAFSGLKLRLLPHVLSSLANLPPPLARLIKRKVAP